MFNWFTKVDRQLDAAVENIDKKIDEIVEERDRALREIDILNAKLKTIQESISDQDMVINFAAVNVFSVERNNKDDVPCTIIGFMVKDGDTERTQEWYLYCSERVHNNIVKSFEEFTNNKNAAMLKYAGL